MIGVGIILALVLCLVLLFLRLSEERGARNHPMILAASCLAFFFFVRIGDLAFHINSPRWSALLGAWALVVYLAAEHRARHTRKDP